ncbi:MAG: PKD domain-containing protein [Bacteroidetes bacterium]|nr:PKD domain-containing protein [Bacteroidota bacterium]
MVVTSDEGCIDTISKSFNVFPLPVANFSYNNGCVGAPINFSNTSTAVVGNITGWNWTFGDGTTSILQNPPHVYSTPGIYTVQLIVTTNGGCGDSIVKQITISPLPVAAFTSSLSCRGTPVQFTSSSSVPNGVLSAWQWNFGNLQTSGLQNPSVNYNVAGTYNVSLIVTSNNGCTDTLIQPVVVHPKPIADAGPQQFICRGDSATFTATGGLTYLWSNGSTSSSISVAPTIGTTYFVTVTDANGCEAIDSVRCAIKGVPSTYAGPDKTICAGQSVALTGWGATNIVWNPGNVNSSTINVSPSQTTTYTVIATGANGCSSADTMVVFVNPLPLANAGPDQMLCEGTTATLTASGGTSYYWSTTGSNNQSIYVNPVLPQIYTVQVTDANGCKAWDTVSVGISPTPVANMNPVFICVGNSTILDAGNPGSSYLWSPNGETTQTISVSDSGYFDVIIVSANGCIGYAGATVYVGGNGLVQNPANVQICDGDSTVLTAGNPGSTYLWSNGATSQTITVGSVGAYTVTITDNTGCSASFANNIIVNPVPSLSFVTSPTCEGGSTAFTNNSTLSQGNITSWIWSFGDGNTSNLINPSNTFPGSGNYNVTLSATTGMGCSTSFNQQVIVEPMPIAFFNNNTACAGSSTNFIDGSIISNGSLASWSWDFGDGNSSSLQSPSYTYANPGLYTVTMIVASVNGCSDTITQQVAIYESPIAQFATANVCEGNSVNFINASSITNGSITGYQWNFGDGNNSTAVDPTHLYASAGTYNVTLTVNSDLGCSATATQSVVIYSNPVAAFTSTSVCNEITTQFTSNNTVNGSTITGVFWDFGDGGSSNLTDPGHLFASNGSYQVYMVATSDQGCIDTAFSQVVVHPVPTADFISGDACLNNAVTLSDQSSISSGTVSNWNWTFGDGTTSTNQNPVHNYSSYGSFNVQLVATSDNGCVDTTNGVVNVFPLPTANFTKADVCQGTVSEFYNLSQIPGGGMISCSWNFGDGTTSVDQNPQHVYANPGTYLVTMIATSQNGCTDTISQSVIIHEPPAAAFQFVNACDGTPVSFTDVSTSFDGPITSWNWNFGDGTVSVSNDPYHSFPASGTYAVTLEVATIYGCTAIVTDSVSVYSLPIPVISSVANCIYDPVTFNNITAVGDTTIYQYLWNFGDGNTSVIQDPNHLYASAGSYNVSLVMTNGNGCSATASTMVDLSPAPDADFNFTDACAETGVQFNNTSTISSGTIASYIWNFGDSSATSGTVNPIHTYDSSGVYTIMLIAISDNGCVDTTIQQITVFPIPVSNFSYSQAEGCGPLTVSFTDSSFISAGTIVSWNWDFGNGETSQLQNPSTVYTTGGTYSVSLTVTSSMGCVQTFTQNNIITIYPGPDANFTADPYEASILHPVINFNNLSSGATSYSWTFGDGTGTSLFEPMHTYPDTGTYSVTLLVINSYGCIDTITQLVHIVPEFVMYVPNAFTPNSDGINDFFTIAGIGIKEVVINIFDRWGENVYTTSNLAKGWDGTVQKDNGTAQQDVYVYDIRVKDVFGKTHQQYGRVTLVR